MKGISFDLQEKKGTAFNLVDSFASGVLGIMGVGSSLLDCFSTVERGMLFIQKQVGVHKAPFSDSGEDDANFRELIAAKIEHLHGTSGEHNVISEATADRATLPGPEFVEQVSDSVVMSSTCQVPARGITGGPSAPRCRVRSSLGARSSSPCRGPPPPCRNNNCAAACFANYQDATPRCTPYNRATAGRPPRPMRRAACAAAVTCTCGCNLPQST